MSNFFSINFTLDSSLESLSSVEKSPCFFIEAIDKVIERIDKNYKLLYEQLLKSYKSRGQLLSQLSENKLKNYHIEMERGESYRLFDVLPLKITFKDFKKGLQEQFGITDTSQQNFIAYLVNQHGIGWLFGVVVTGVDELLMALTTALGLKHEHLITLINDDEKTSIKLSYDQIKNELRLVTKTSIVLQDQIDATKMINQGDIQATLKLVLDDDLKVKQNVSLNFNEDSIVNRLKDNSLEVKKSASKSNNPNFLFRLKQKITNNPWTMFTVIMAFVLGVAGAALAATGIFLPLGGFLLGISANISMGIAIGVMSVLMAKQAIAVVDANIAVLPKDEKPHEEIKQVLAQDKQDKKEQAVAATLPLVIASPIASISVTVRQDAADNGDGQKPEPKPSLPPSPQ